METVTFDPREEVIEDFLDGEPRAATWRELKEALASRLKYALDDLKASNPDSPDHTALVEKVAELREQIAALAQEEAITQFVEDAVRSSLSRPRPFPEFDEDEEY